MVQELAAESANQGLKMNKSKTKVMMENDTPIWKPYERKRPTGRPARQQKDELDDY